MEEKLIYCCTEGLISFGPPYRGVVFNVGREASLQTEEKILVLGFLQCEFSSRTEKSWYHHVMDGALRGVDGDKELCLPLGATYAVLQMICYIPD